MEKFKGIFPKDLVMANIEKKKRRKL